MGKRETPQGKLRQAIEMAELSTEAWAVKHGLTGRTVARLLQAGKTNNLRVAVTVQRATGGEILPEEWVR